MSDLAKDDITDISEYKFIMGRLENSLRKHLLIISTALSILPLSLVAELLIDVYTNQIPQWDILAIKGSIILFTFLIYVAFLKLNHLNDIHMHTLKMDHFNQVNLMTAARKNLDIITNRLSQIPDIDTVIRIMEELPKLFNYAPMKYIEKKFSMVVKGTLEIITNIKEKFKEITTEESERILNEVEKQTNDKLVAMGLNPPPEAKQ